MRHGNYGRVPYVKARFVVEGRVKTLSKPQSTQHDSNSNNIPKTNSQEQRVQQVRSRVTSALINSIKINEILTDALIKGASVDTPKKKAKK